VHFFSEHIDPKTSFDAQTPFIKSPGCLYSFTITSTVILSLLEWPLQSWEGGGGSCDSGLLSHAVKWAARPMGGLFEVLICIQK
jgi:hypothetical protein